MPFRPQSRPFIMPAVLIGVSALPAESYPQNLIRIMPAEGLRHSLPLRLVFLS